MQRTNFPLGINKSVYSILFYLQACLVTQSGYMLHASSWSQGTGSDNLWKGVGEEKLCKNRNYFKSQGNNCIYVCVSLTFFFIPAFMDKSLQWKSIFALRGVKIWWIFTVEFTAKMCVWLTPLGTAHIQHEYVHTSIPCILNVLLR